VFVVPLLVQGVAMGMFFVALFTISLDRLPPDRVPAASGLNNFLRITSGSFATSLTTTYWDRREALHQSRLVESLSAYDPNYAGALAQLHAHGFGGGSAPAMLLQQVRPGLSALQSGSFLFLRLIGDVGDPALLARAATFRRCRGCRRRIEGGFLSASVLATKLPRGQDACSSRLLHRE